MESIREIISKELSCEIKFRVSIDTIVKLSKVQSLNGGDLRLEELFEKLLDNYLIEKSPSQTKQKRARYKMKVLSEAENSSMHVAPRIVRRNMQFISEQIRQY